MSLECYIGPEQNLLETTRGACPPAAAAASDSVERAAGRAQAHEPSRLAVRRRSTSPGRAAKATPGWSTALDRICDEAEAAIDEGYSLVVLSDRDDRPRPRAAQFAAGDRRRASSPCAQSEADADRHRRRNGRSPRSASPLPARRLRRRCDQSVPGVRGALASPPRWPAATAAKVPTKPSTAGEGDEHPAIDAVANGEDYDPVTEGRSRTGRRVSQGRRQGHAQGDGQDGHLDAAKLQGRPDLRSGRPAATK